MHSTHLITKEPPKQLPANDLPGQKLVMNTVLCPKFRVARNFCRIINHTWDCFVQTWHVRLLYRQLHCYPVMHKIHHQKILEANTPDALSQIYMMGALMLAVGCRLYCMSMPLLTIKGI